MIQWKYEWGLNLARTSQGTECQGWRSKLQRLGKLARPFILILGPLLLMGVFAVVFEYLPKPADGQVQSISYITRTLAQQAWTATTPVKAAGSAGLRRLLWALPAWVPWWTVAMPSGRFDPRVPSAEAIAVDASKISGALGSLVAHRYFRIFKIDLNAKCPFWVRKDICSSNGACSVCECEDHLIPHAWKEIPTENFVVRNGDNAADALAWGGELDSSDLDQITSSFSQRVKTPQLYFDSISDEHSRNASYVDLSLNRPKNTGYGRTPIWQYIYKENCMGRPTNPLASSAPGSASLNGECQEEDAFYKILSGLQSVIASLVARNYHDKSPPPPGRGVSSAPSALPNLQISLRPKFSLAFFRQSLALHRDRIENLYFTFSLMMRTICAAKDVLRTCTPRTGIPEEGAEAQAALRRVVDVACGLNSCDAQHVAHPIFHRKSSLALRQFRNITRIMDCVECESCRLHAKVKVLALYLSLKATGESLRIDAIERNELIALVNAANYFSEGVVAVQMFQRVLLGLKILFFVVGLAVAGSAVAAINWKYSVAARIRSKLVRICTGLHSRCGTLLTSVWAKCRRSFGREEATPVMDERRLLELLTADQSPTTSPSGLRLRKRSAKQKRPSQGHGS